MYLQDIPKNRLAYLAGPYTAKLPDGTEDHALVAERMRLFYKCVEALMKRGIKTCSPLMMHGVRTVCPQLPGDWTYWGDYSEVLLKRSDFLIILRIPGWENSTGVSEEVAIARMNNIPTIYIDPQELVPDQPTNAASEESDDGAILIKVSKIKNPLMRRLAIAGSFVPIVAITTLLVGASALKTFVVNCALVCTTAKKHW